MKLGYPDYRDLIECILAFTRERLAERLVSLVLFGSVARGEAGPDSDIDLLLIIEDVSEPYQRRIIPVTEIIARTRRHACWRGLAAAGLFPEFSVIVLTRDEANENRAIYLDMISESIILADRDDFFSSRLESMRERVVELGAVRVETPSGWYWDLKPDLRLGESVRL